MLNSQDNMDNNEARHWPGEDYTVSTTDDNITPTERHDTVPPPPPPADDNDRYPEGITFNWIPLAIAVMFCFSGAVSDWRFYLTLAVAVIIHEFGHVMMGKAFGCSIAEMQVFFFSFLSYKPKQKPGGSAWRDITWSLGVLPWGGFTTFKARVAPTQGMYRQQMEYNAASSPYINDKPAWQRLLISAAGVLFNFATFLVMYITAIVMPSFYWPEYLAKISLILALLNILPIFPLDGGSILFTIYEMVTGKKPSSQFTKWSGIIGFIIIVLFFWIFPEWLNRILGSVMGSIF